ncbi:MAG TPA: hypothetical protein VM261_00460 [Kofleriaceae bacterium]|nr:hypothetical protein [Kofleriaceae bacterium]
MKLALAAAVVVGASGCERLLGIGEPSLETDATPEPSSCDPVDEPITRQFVIDGLHAPMNEAIQEAAFDIDGDGRADNRVFDSLGLIAQAEPELDLQPTIDENLSAGRMLQLLEANLGEDCATTTLYEGADRDVPVNPSDNFSGQESFRVVGTARGRMLGVHIDGSVLPGDRSGVAELRLPLFRGTAPIELPLVAARVRYVLVENGMILGAIGGAIRADVVDGLVIPSFAASVQAVAERDCSGTYPDCCDDGSAGAVVVSAFDQNADCEITVEEVRNDSLTQSLLAPDVDLYNGGVLDPNRDGIPDAVSIGIPFTAVNAFFLTSAAARE